MSQNREMKSKPLKTIKLKPYFYKKIQLYIHNPYHYKRKEQKETYMMARSLHVNGVFNKPIMSEVRIGGIGLCLRQHELPKKRVLQGRFF